MLSIEHMVLQVHHHNTSLNNIRIITGTVPSHPNHDVTNSHILMMQGEERPHATSNLDRNNPNLHMTTCPSIALAFIPIIHTLLQHLNMLRRSRGMSVRHIHHQRPDLSLALALKPLR
jgi:hypothetical protein